MHRFVSWINQSTFRVAPATPPSSSTMYVSENDSSSTDSFTTNCSIRKKRVHFADDCGEALESVHEIPDQLSNTKGMFHESLDEAYVDKHGVLTAFLKITKLESDRKLLVRYTENGWRTHETILAHRVIQPRRVQSRTNAENSGKSDEQSNAGENRSRDDDSASTVSGEEDVMRYSFRFALRCKKLNCIELIVISTLDGVVDYRHENCYMLNDPRRCVETATSGRFVKCW